VGRILILDTVVFAVLTVPGGGIPPERASRQDTDPVSRDFGRVRSVPASCGNAIQRPVRAHRKKPRNKSGPPWSRRFPCHSISPGWTNQPRIQHRKCPTSEEQSARSQSAVTRPGRRKNTRATKNMSKRKNCPSSQATSVEGKPLAVHSRLRRMCLILFRADEIFHFTLYAVPVSFLKRQPFASDFGAAAGKALHLNT